MVGKGVAICVVTGRTIKDYDITGFNVLQVASIRHGDGIGIVRCAGAA